MNCTVTIMFFYIGVLVTKRLNATVQINRNVLNQSNHISEDLSKKQMTMALQSEKVIGKSIFKMWLMIATLMLLNVWSLCFAIVKKFTPADECHYFFNTIWNISSIADRLVICILWVLPIIYVFWPLNRTWYGKLRQNSTSI